MTIRFSCPKCEAPFQVADDKAGKRSKCPACRTFLTVPLRSTTLDPVQAAPEIISDQRSASKPLSEEDIFRMLEEMRAEEVSPVKPVKNRPADETVMEDAVKSSLTPTPAIPMPPVPPPPSKNAPPPVPTQVISASEAAEAAIRRVREVRKGS